MNLNHREAFLKTREHYDIKGSKLREVTGVSANHISEYSRGKRDVSSAVLDKLIDGMDKIKPGAKRYYCELLLGKEPITAEEIVSNMDADELSKLMMVIAARIGSGNVRISNSPLLVS